eukprot:5256497-Amphidinium_carterae.1
MWQQLGGVSITTSALAQERQKSSDSCSSMGSTFSCGDLSKQPQDSYTIGAECVMCSLSCCGGVVMAEMMLEHSSRAQTPRDVAQDSRVEAVEQREYQPAKFFNTGAVTCHWFLVAVSSPCTAQADVSLALLGGYENVNTLDEVSNGKEEELAAAVSSISALQKYKDLPRLSGT